MDQFNATGEFFQPTDLSTPSANFRGQSESQISVALQTVSQLSTPKRQKANQTDKLSVLKKMRSIQTQTTPCIFATRHVQTQCVPQLESKAAHANGRF